MLGGSQFLLYRFQWAACGENIWSTTVDLVKFGTLDLARRSTFLKLPPVHCRSLYDSESNGR